jgi:plasmid stability protein
MPRTCGNGAAHPLAFNGHFLDRLTEELDVDIITDIMGDILIRNVPEVTVARLKARAKRHGRSLQTEALAALEAGGRYSDDAFLDELARLHASKKIEFDVTGALAALRGDRSR